MKLLTRVLGAGLLVGLALLLFRSGAPAQTVGYSVSWYRVPGGCQPTKRTPARGPGGGSDWI